MNNFFVMGLIAVVLQFGWPFVLVAALIFRKRLQNNLKWVILFAIAMPIAGVLIFGLKHADTRKRAKELEQKYLDEQKQAMLGFKDGDFQSLRRVAGFLRLYSGKEVRVRGKLSDVGGKFILSDDDFCGGHNQLNIHMEENTPGSDIRGLVEIDGTLDKKVLGLLNVKSVVQHARWSKEDCE